MKTAFIVIIAALALCCCFLCIVCLWLERKVFDLKLRVEEAEEVLELGDIDWTHGEQEDLEGGGS